MPRFSRKALALSLILAGFAWAAALGAQEAGPPARPPEGNWIINLPSADIPRAGTLSLLFTHRFSQPVTDSDIHSLFSFDSAADIKLGLSYVPLPNLEIALERDPAHCFCGQGSSSASAQPQGLEIYELAAKYRLWTRGPLGLALRLGEDWRTARGLENRSGFFAQSIVALTVGSRVRITAVPTYVSKTSGQPLSRFTPPVLHTDIFNVPLGLSGALTRSVNVHGEVVPRVGHAGSRGLGWMASIEKTVPRHRFAFTVGNLRATTVDQYIASDFRAASAIPAFAPRDYYLGFNLIRQWNLK